MIENSSLFLSCLSHVTPTIDTESAGSDRARQLDMQACHLRVRKGQPSRSSWSLCPPSSNLQTRPWRRWRSNSSPNLLPVLGVVRRLAAQNVKEVLQSILAPAKLDRSQITTWILHPGGREVLLAMCKELGLSGQDLRWSEEVLAQYGNLSSPSVFFFLDAALRDSAPSGFWWMSSFGAGFSCHGALLHVQ